MNDMSQVIIPRSDQINADTLLSGPMTVTIKDVHISGGQEQPVSIALEETELFYRPCKSMSRVLVGAWGADAKAYIGRSLTLYRDPEVKWGGLAVGGIRISHMTHIDGPKQMMLTATKGSRKPHKVLPLADAPKSAPATDDPAAKWAGGFIAKLATLGSVEAVDDFAIEKVKKLAELQVARPDLHGQVMDEVAKRKAELSPESSSFDDDDLTGDQPAETPIEDPLRATLRQIEDAKTLADVDKIDNETEAGRAFLGDAQLARLDEALSVRRGELRAAEQESVQ